MQSFKRFAILLLLFASSQVLGCPCPPGSTGEDCLCDCCKDVKLDTTSARISLTAFCPVWGLLDPSHPYPYEYVYSRLHLDECLTVDKDQRGVQFIDMQGNVNPAGIQNITSTCSSTDFTLNGSDLHVQGNCTHNTGAIVSLNTISNTSIGVGAFLGALYCGTQAWLPWTMRGFNPFPDGAGGFDHTCNNIVIGNATKWLEANCSTNPFQETDKRDGWRVTSLYLPDCFSRDPDLGNINQAAVRDELMNRSMACDLTMVNHQATVQLTCAYDHWNKTISLPDIVWNRNGTLGCYNSSGRDSPAPGLSALQNLTVPRRPRVRRKGNTEMFYVPDSRTRSPFRYH